MAGSRRRKARTKVKVTIRAKRKKFQRAAVPQELVQQRPQIEKKLGARPDWHTEQTTNANYQSIGFLNDPNGGFGRNTKQDAIQHKVEELQETGEEPESDDDLKVSLGRMRSSGAAPPQPLTAHQKKIVGRLVEAHGDNVEAMAKDKKLNPMLHPPAKLRKLLAGYELHRGKQNVGFRVPSKRLW